MDLALGMLRSQFIRIMEAIGEWALLIVDVISATFKRPPSWALIQEQCYNIGVLSTSVVAITGFTTGFVLAAQSIYQLSEKGLAAVTGILVAKAMITELGPILTAFMVTGRVGSAMCAELGSMRVTEQIEALKSMAVNPSRYLVAPRFIAGIIMVPLLTIISMATGIFGGYIIAVKYFHMASSTYFDPIPIHITGFDLFTGVFKSVVFGILLVTICCYKGMKTSGGAAGVGKSITQSVVITYIHILVWDFLLTMALNTLHQEYWNWFG